MPIIDKYLFSEVSKALVAILLFLVLVILSHSLVRMLEMVAIGRLNSDVLAEMVGLQVLRLLPRLLPPAFFFAVLFALGRLYRDSEMIALEACGLGLTRTYRIFLVIALPLTLITGWLSLATQPWTAARMEFIKVAQKNQATQLAAVEEGRFNEYGRGDLVLYVESFTDNENMSNIFAQHRDGGDVKLITAQRGFQRVDETTGDLYLVLAEGQRYQGIPGQADYSIGQFNEYAVRISASNAGFDETFRKATPNHILFQSTNIKDQAELQDRLSYPLAVLAFTMLSIPLSRSLPRQGVYGRMFFAFLVYFIVLNLQGVSKKWMEQQVTPLWLGTWWVPALVITIALLLALPQTAWFCRIRWRLLHRTAT